MTGFSMSDFNSTCAEIFNTIREIKKSLASQDLQRGLVPWFNEFTGETTEEGLKNGLARDTVVPHGDSHTSSTDHDVAGVFVDVAAHHGSMDAYPSDPICLESPEFEPKGVEFAEKETVVEMSVACNGMSFDIEETSDSILRPSEIRFGLKSDAVVTTIDRVFSVLQPKVTVDLYETFSYLLDSKVAVVDWNGETSSEWKSGVVNNILKSRLTPVCENDLVDFTSVFVTKMALVGSWCPTQPFKLAPVYVQPPAKPPDKSINMLQMLDSHMIPMLMSISLKYVILHVLEGVLAVERSDCDLLSLVRLEYLNTWISRLQTKVFSVDFSSVFGSLQSEVVIEAMESRVWSSDQHFPNYLHLCISIICENVPRISSASSDTRWHFMGYYHILCEWNDVQNIWSWFEKPLWLPTDVTSYILLWHGLFLCTGAEDFVKSLDMGCFVIVLKNEEVILCDFTHKIQGRQRAPSLCSSGSFVVFLIVSAVVMHYLHLNLICKHVLNLVLWFNGAYEYGLIVAGHASYFEADSANLNQPINMVLSGEVIPKGFVKLLLCNEQAKLEHDIIIIGIDTEGTNPSKFSLTFDTVWVNKQICKFIWKVMLWARTCLTQDSEAVKVYQERRGLRRYIHGQGCANFCCCNLTSHSSPIEWVGSLFRLVLDKILDTHYNSVMRCLLDAISFISRGCYIKPLMLKANSTRMVDWQLQLNSKIEFMVTLQRIEKDGQILGTHKLQFLCFLAHQKAYDFFPSKISNWVAFFASHWTTFFSQILSTMNLKLDKMEGTQIYGTNLQHRILCFKQMLLEFVEIDQYAFSAVFKAYSDLATLQLGQQVHNLAMKMGTDVFDYVVSSLIFMYCKCGCTEDARKAFDETPQGSAIIWNSIIFGYAQHGQGNTALDLFHSMRNRLAKPDHITFVAELTACSHIGLLGKVAAYGGAVQGMIMSVESPSAFIEDNTINQKNKFVNHISMYSLSRPPEFSNLEDKVDFKGLGMIRACEMMRH